MNDMAPKVLKYLVILGFDGTKVFTCSNPRRRLFRCG